EVRQLLTPRRRRFSEQVWRSHGSIECVVDRRNREQARPSSSDCPGRRHARWCSHALRFQEVAGPLRFWRLGEDQHPHLTMLAYGNVPT
ncbi:MAG TPA: hypothetical protein VGL94_07200, partial [Ktedonobacteraceae bacterium]